ncbi:DJ-1/PfpI family protein [Ktedonosporobacter rubrisoli]|uniref:DJ-1/PfpI family protein n=1 Tax=Ktedonosporobacter rubrisoli TaxID=2509675 RepID=A0A4P6JMN6_KTERU|nr:DJ-1/PfpI family protein [Ktedonosporobacter rubrisoli]QBD76403.1 DJ-1/PfpI family protein [Ktedonosporobacter rubrisoli]
MSRKVAILIFNDVEVLDFCGPFEVFGTAGAGQSGEKPFEVFTVAEQAGPVLARNGLSVNSGYTLENCPQPDILLIPGGASAAVPMKNEVVLHWIRAQAERVELLLSVCNGALVLASAGLLEGLTATTHYLEVERLRAMAPNTTLCPEKRYVDNGKIVLSAGISAGIDMSLYIVARLLGEEQAANTAAFMQYDYWHGSIPAGS